MHTFCDRCNEAVDQPIGITKDPELAELAGDLGYRNVCPGCYDDLIAEAEETRELHGDNRRAESRIPASFTLTLEDSAGVEQEVTAEDVSPNGVRVRAVRPLETGTVVRISTDGAHNVDAVAIVEVIWHDGETLHAGLRLVETSDSWTRLVGEHGAEAAS